MQYLGAISKMIEWSHVQGKPFNITVIQVYVWTTNAKEDEVEQLSEDPQDLLELTPKKDVLFTTGDWKAKVGGWDIPGGGGLVTKSCPTLVTPWTVACQAPLCPWDSPGKNPTGVGCRFLLQTYLE